MDLEDVRPQLTDQEKAAIVIQSRIRGFLVRKTWGPILEERIKRIVSNISNPEEAENELKKAGLSTEDAANVIQRFYRRWKVNRDETPVDEEEEKELGSPVSQNWDAPFRIVEKHMKELRAGVKKRQKVDMAAHRREMIMAGLASQDWENQERERAVAGRWQNVISTAGGDERGKAIQGKQLGKYGKHLLTVALEQKMLEMRRSPERQIEVVAPPKRKFSLAEILQSSTEEPAATSLKSPLGPLPKKAPLIDGDDVTQGPFDFRRNLRRAPTRPTDSLRKGWSSESHASLE